MLFSLFTAIVLSTVLLPEILRLIRHRMENAELLATAKAIHALADESRRQHESRERQNDPILKAMTEAIEHKQRKALGLLSSSLAPANTIVHALQIKTGTDGEFQNTEATPYRITRTHRVAVENTGDGFVSNCKLHVTYFLYDKQLSALLEDTFTLQSGEKRYIDVVSYGEGIAGHDSDTDIRICAPLAPVYDGGIIRLPLTSQMLILRATSTESQPHEVKCLAWIGQGQLRFEEIG